jgi:hypothetical protein
MRKAPGKRLATGFAVSATSSSMNPAAVFPVLVASSLGAALLICLSFRWCANGEKLERARDEMTANLLGVRLFRDQVTVAFACYARLAGAAGRYLLHMSPALAVLALPMYLLCRETAARLDRVAPPSGESLLFTASLRPGSALDAARLELPPWIRLTAPPLHAPVLNEITWRLQAHACGSYDVSVWFRKSRASRRIEVCDSLQRLAGGEQLPADGSVTSLAIDYAERRLTMAGHDFDWEAPFFILVALFALLLKPLTGAQF